jgi:hypothetical protein
VGMIKHHATREQVGNLFMVFAKLVETKHEGYACSCWSMPDWLITMYYTAKEPEWTRMTSWR